MADLIRLLKLSTRLGEGLDGKLAPSPTEKLAVRASLLVIIGRFSELSLFLPSSSAALESILSVSQAAEPSHVSMSDEVSGVGQAAGGGTDTVFCT